MNIVDIRILRGPNIWSNYRNRLIQLKLDLGDLESFPTNKIPGFPNRLEKLLPSMYSHRCSEDYEGGFFHRVREGTWLGHVTEHIALELQSLAGLECGYGRTRSTSNEGVYFVVFGYIIEEAGVYAAKAAVRIVDALVKGEEYDLTADIEELRKIKEDKEVDPTLQPVVDEAAKREIPYSITEDVSVLRLGYGKFQITACARGPIPELGAIQRLPIVAVTGTNGKTTTVRLTAHIASIAGYSVGHTTTDGIFVKNQRIQKGDCSGPSSARTILNNREVDLAVLECARGGILRAGLGFDSCDVSVVTNITEDHLGLADINSLADLAKVKVVVPRSTRKEGYAILNADDDYVYEMKKEADCNLALFTMNADNERVARHREKGGLAATIKKGQFVIYKAKEEFEVAAVNEVPITMEGRAECMINNVLPCILASYVQGIEIEIIRKGLLDFHPTAEQTPGRMNIFNLPHCQVMVDYAHNTAGFEMLKSFMQRTSAAHKIGIIAAAGDRRDQDIIYMGKCAAEMFDEIIIRHDKDGRGRTNENLTTLFQKGIGSFSKDFPRMVISDELEAMKYAIKHAPKGSFIVVCSDDIHNTIEYLSTLVSQNSRVAV